MAVTFNKTNNYGYFSKVSPKASDLAEKIEAAGGTIEVQFQALLLTHPKVKAMHPTPVNSTAVIKGTVPMEYAAMLIDGVEQFLTKNLNLILGVHVPNPPKITTAIPSWQAVPPTPSVKLSFDENGEAHTISGDAAKYLKEMITKMTTPEAKALINEMLKNPEVAKMMPVSTTTQTAPYHKNGPGVPVKLSTATSLNQPVNGSSAGAVYRVFALGPHIKLAARLQPGKLSVRAEGNLLPGDVASLVTLGFTDNGSYLSVHYSLGMIPAERVLGALMFCKDLKFTYRVNSIAELTFNG